MNPADFALDPRPIGVFDSGVGGLTVLKSLMALMPGESFVYLGDTARVPYGTKSADTVRGYSMDLARILLSKNVKMIVIACNTASVHGAKAIAEFVAPIPVIEMVAPAAAAAAAATKNNSILLMATQSTVRSAAYPAALHAINPALEISSIPTQILVALAEEGWVDGEVAENVVGRYIRSYFTTTMRPDTVILGCTHFPLLREVIARIAGDGVTLIDSGEAAARYILKNFRVRTDKSSAKTPLFFATDSVDRFAPMVERFLGHTALQGTVEQIDLMNFEIQNPSLSKAI
ncbi:MAG: glutamate racemase [Micavibrio sp.]|nr:glutamate racemase [Micavibrio sp.]